MKYPIKFPLKVYLNYLDANEAYGGYARRVITFPTARTVKQCSNFLEKELHVINPGEMYRLKQVITRGARNNNVFGKPIATCVACLDEFYTSREIKPNA